jgi:hypothetical protein
VNNSEIKATIDKMTDDERFFAAAYLQHLAQERDPAYGQMLAQRLNRGRTLSLEQVHRIHNTLEAEGL